MLQQPREADDDGAEDEGGNGEAGKVVENTKRIKPAWEKRQKARKATSAGYQRDFFLSRDSN